MSNATTFYAAVREGRAVRLLWVERGAIKSQTRLDVTVPSDRKMGALLERLNCSGPILPPSAHGYAAI